MVRERDFAGARDSAACELQKIMRIDWPKLAVSTKDNANIYKRGCEQFVFLQKRMRIVKLLIFLNLPTATGKIIYSIQEKDPIRVAPDGVRCLTDADDAASVASTAIVSHPRLRIKDDLLCGAKTPPVNVTGMPVPF